ncbi:zinc finger BED domain-containing protein 4-like [Centruroides sculpturatus]|uniref:zinc finger BED domain-containing protein 4-like n=1 Tax=Centruroides sculpturatus TaxID=218467 RepID=UPI000C6E0CA8|nr:zinc finger BED domain-containing protein 4-like [Centruroides sculpturatus]
MICVDIQPYSVVSDLGFQRLLKKIVPNYNIPSRKYFSENIIPDIFQKVQLKIQKAIYDAKYISLTADIWTATTNNSPFLSVTAHWLKDDFQQERAVLRIVPFEGSHTATRISEQINIVLEQYKLTSDKIFLVLRDSAANMVAGIRNCNLEALSCFIHTLQLTLNECIFSQQDVKTIITVNRNIVTHFNHSAVAVSKLEDLQEKLGLQKHKLIQDVPTRWNSTYYMLQRNLEQQKALVTYAIDNKIPTLSPYQWSLIEKIVLLLKPFEEITMEASKRETTSSSIIPTIKTLKLFLSKAKSSSSFSGINTTIEKLENSIKKRFSAYIENKSLCLSSLLDTRFKIKFQKEDMVEEIKRWAIDSLEDVDNSKSQEKLNFEVSTSGDDEDGGESLSFSNLFDELASGKRKNEEEHVFKKKEKAKEMNKRFDQELETYLHLPLKQRHSDPFLWWRSSKELFPNLSELAMKYLSAPASSIESERIFSTGGNIYEPARNRLCPENGEILMFLHYNLRVLQFEY